MKKKFLKISTFIITFVFLFFISISHTLAYVNLDVRYNADNYESYTEYESSLSPTFLIEKNYLLVSFPLLDYDDISTIKTANYNYENGINTSHYYELDSVISVNGTQIIETYNSEDIIEQGEILFFKSSLARYNSTDTIIFYDFMINEFLQGHDNGNATVYIYGNGNGTNVDVENLSIQNVQKNSDNKLVVNFNKAYLTSIYSGVKNVVVDGVEYSNITLNTDSTTGLTSAIINDYELNITSDIKLITIEKINLSFVGNTNTGVLNCNYKINTTTKTTHVCCTMTPYIINRTSYNPIPGKMFGKVYYKDVFFNYISNETGLKIDNINKVQCKYIYNDNDNYTAIKDVENISNKYNTLGIVSYQYYDKGNLDGALYIANDSAKSVSKAKWGVECDYIWSFFTQKKISDFRLIYAWYENETGIVQGSTYENGMYSVVDENGNEVVYTYDGKIVDGYTAENGVIKDDKGNEIEIDTPSIPDNGDKWDDTDIFDNIKNLFNDATDKLKQVLKIVAIVGACIVGLLVLNTVIKFLGFSKSILYYLALPFKKLFSLFKKHKK